MSDTKKTLPLLGVLFLGYFGFSLALPIFPMLFIGDNLMPPIAHLSVEYRRILLGILFTMFPLGQFLGNPILGSLSDKYGRKPVLLISLLLATPMFLLCSLAISYNNLTLLFVGRFLCGLFEGNVVIAQSSLSDLSKTSESKKKRFGWIISISSVGFLFGPLIGSYLSDSSIFPFFSLATPFIATSFLFILSFLTILLFFKETLPVSARIQTYKASIISIFKSFAQMLSLKGCRNIYLCNAIAFMGVFFFLNFFSASLVTRFHFSIKALAGANSFLSLCFIISPPLMTLFFRKMPIYKVLRITCACLALSLCFFIANNQVLIMFLILLPIGFFLSICFTYPPLLISESVDNTIQGKALGANMSIQMLSESITALVGGFLMAIAPSLSTVVAIVFLLLASLTYGLLKRS